MENKRKHLEFIQAVINRLAGNSFLLKGWTVALLSALFILSAKDANQIFIAFAYFPAIVFWILDGYFLSQERLFRSLYNKVRKLNEKEIDFSMERSEFTKEDRNSWIGSIFSCTLLVFYLPIIAILLIVQL